MKLLLDTCVVSDISKASIDSQIIKFLKRHQHDTLFLSVITVGEIMRGILLLPSGKKRDALESWFHALRRDYADRILQIDSETALIWGEISENVKRSGFSLPAMDGMVAATGLRHGMHIVTQNEKDFQHTGALIINPGKFN